MFTMVQTYPYGIVILFSQDEEKGAPDVLGEISYCNNTKIQLMKIMEYLSKRTHVITLTTAPSINSVSCRTLHFLTVAVVQLTNGCTLQNTLLL